MPLTKAIKSQIWSSLHSRGIEVRRATKCSGMDPLEDIRKLSGGKPIDTILDVGANVGQSAVHFKKSFPAATVHSFEPTPESVIAGRATTAGLADLHWHECAVGRENATARFAATGVSQTNSLIRSDAKKSVDVTREVQVVSLDEFCASHSIETIDLLKTDTEGFDLGVMEGAARLFAERRVRFVLCEVGFSEADTEHSFFPPIASFLEKLGFRLAHFYGISPVEHFQRFNVCYADALFVPTSIAQGAKQVSTS